MRIRRPSHWLRLPRPTARLRLTVLYGAAFLVCGGAVLAVVTLVYDFNVGAPVTIALCAIAVYVVASDAVNADQTQKALYMLAVPHGVDLNCLTLQETADAWKSGPRRRHGLRATGSSLSMPRRTGSSSSASVNACAAPNSFSPHTRRRNSSPRTSVAQVTSQMLMFPFGIRWPNTRALGA